MTKRSAPFNELAYWPQEPDDSPLDYIRILLGELLKRHARLLLEGTLIEAQSDTREFECLARLSSGTFRAAVFDGKATIEAVGNGPTPGAAYLNAVLLVIRQATLGDNVPVLGRLLSKGRLAVDLEAREVTRGRPGRYVLHVQEDHRDLPWMVDLERPRFPSHSYLLDAYVRPGAPGKRTTYLMVSNLNAPENAALKEYVASNMYVDGAIYAHRLLLALAARAVNDMKTFNLIRKSLGLEVYEDDRRHAHHLDGFGLNNRQANLIPLTPEQHAIRHADWTASYEGLKKQVDSNKAIHLVPQVITDRIHFDKLGITDHLGVATLSRLNQARSPDGSPLDRRPVTIAEIESFAGKKPSTRNIRLTLSALKSLGGQGRSSAILSARSVSRISENTVRNALSKLESARIIACDRIEKDGETGFGAEKHYRLLRPLGQDVLRLMRHKPTRAI